MRNLQSLPSAGKHARVERGGADCSLGPTAPSSSYGLVQQGSDILLLVPVGRAEHHDSILRKRAETVKGRSESGTCTSECTRITTGA